MNRVFVPGPKSSARKAATVPFRSAIEMPWSTTRPSTWWKTGECVASTSSLRYTRPGTMRRSGAPWRRISRICTGDVCVRSSRGETALRSTKSVSCESRAGWSGGKFSASKLWKSFSISGPSAIE